jgi:hypothetical protein
MNSKSIVRSFFSLSITALSFTLKDIVIGGQFGLGAAPCLMATLPRGPVRCRPAVRARRA